MNLKRYAELCMKLETHKRRLRLLRDESLEGGNCWVAVKSAERRCIIAIEKLEREMVCRKETK